MNDAATSPQARLSARIRDEQRAWREVVSEVGEDHMLEPGPMGDWSFRDLAAHLLGWRERTLARLEAAAAGRPEPPTPWPAELEDDDAINDWIQEQSSGRSAQDVLQAVDASFDRLAHALAAFPDERLTDPAGVPGAEGTPAIDVDWVSHWHHEHEPSVRDWLARRG